MEAGRPEVAQPNNKDAPKPESTSGTVARPNLTHPQRFAFVAFALFVALALVAGEDKPLNPTEYGDLKTLTLFLIGALLPSDALIRYGRNLLFKNVDDPSTSAKDAPATTVAQKFALGVYLIVVIALLFNDDFITATESEQIIEVACALIVALLPSDAGIRFGRALYLKEKVPNPTKAELARV